VPAVRCAASSSRCWPSRRGSCISSTAPWPARSAWRASSRNCGDVSAGAYEALAGREFDIIINASSAGLSGEAPPLNAAVLTERSCCYDLLYGAAPTPFMRWAAHHAAWAVSDGLGMLVEQAAEAFFVWHAARPETGPVIQQLRGVLSAAA
jgi:shikimate dehydrogenase